MHLIGRKPALRQQPEAFPDRVARNAECLGELGLPQRVARNQVAGEDAVANAGGDQVRTGSALEHGTAEDVPGANRTITALLSNRWHDARNGERAARP
jgi:hypothetical protein